MIADLPHQGAVLGVGGEVLEPPDVVQRYFNDGSPGGGELVVIHREAVRLDVTAARVGRRVEIDHHRAFLQGVFEGEIEALAGEGGLGREIGRGVALLQRGQGRENQGRRE